MSDTVSIARRLPLRFTEWDLAGVPSADGFQEVHHYASKIASYALLGRGLLLMGPNGVGKTGALAALTNRTRDVVPQWGSYDRLWCRARDIAMLYQHYKYDEETGEPIDALYNDAAWLVIDELGREHDLKNFSSRLRHLLSVRYDNMKVTHMATNMTLEQIQDVYGNGFVSLLHSACLIVVVGGEDRRVQ